MFQEYWYWQLNVLPGWFFLLHISSLFWHCHQCRHPHSYQKTHPVRLSKKWWIVYYTMHLKSSHKKWLHAGFADASIVQSCFLPRLLSKPGHGLCHKKENAVDSNWGPFEEIGSLCVFLLPRARERGLRCLENLEAGTLKGIKMRLWIRRFSTLIREKPCLGSLRLLLE